MFVWDIVSHLIIFLLVSMMVTLILNILIRPTLWTYFNICLLTYYCLNVLLGSLNLHLLSSIVTDSVSLSHMTGETVRAYIPCNLGGPTFNIDLG